MPGTSLKFPPEKAGFAIPPVKAQSNIQGIIHTPEGDVRTWVISAGLNSVGRFLWNTLGALDIQDQQQVKTMDMLQAQQLKIDALQQALLTLTVKLDPLVQLAQSLGVSVPDWKTRDDVENGRPDMTDVLSAAQAGLRATFTVIQDQGIAPRQIIEMNPETGTFVARGTEVLITVNDG